MSRILTMFGCVLLPIMVGGQNVSQEVLQLAQKALEKGHELQNQRAEAEKIRLDAKSIRQRYIPRVEAYGTHAYFSNGLITSLELLPNEWFSNYRSFDVNGHFFNVGLLAKMVLFSGLQIPYGAKATEQKARIQDFIAQKSAADLLSELLITVDQVALLKHYKAILEQSDRRLQKEVERVDRGVKIGLATPYEERKIGLARLMLESKWLDYESKRFLLYEKLAMLTGVENQVLQRLKFDLQAWKWSERESTVENRPEIKALEASIQMIGFKRKMEQCAFLPKVQLFGSYSHVGLYGLSMSTGTTRGRKIGLEFDKIRSYPTWLVGLGIRWDLFDGFHQKHELEKNHWDKVIVMNKKEHAEKQFRLLSKKLENDFALSQKQVRLKIKQKQLVGYALEIATKSYHEGLISVSEMLETESSFQAAQLEHLQAICDQRKAAVELLKSYGALDIGNLNRF